MSAEHRAALYTFMVAVIGLITVYGLVTIEQADAWTRVAEAAVNLGAAIALIIARHHVPGAPRRASTDDN